MSVFGATQGGGNTFCTPRSARRYRTSGLACALLCSLSTGGPGRLASNLALVLAATDHDPLPAFSLAMFGFAMPLTAVTLLVLGARALLKDWPRTTARV